MKQCPTCHRAYIDSQPDCPLDRAQLVPSALPPSPGVGRELGTYRLVGLLAEGGMGSVYIAAHTKLKRYVAIKVLRPELANRRELVSRFFAEARTVDQLRHPNIVESIDMVEDVIDGAYAVLELLRGPDIKTRLAAGPIPLDSALRIAAQIADALAAVHAHGIVHRDLKPENVILIERDGRSDFVKLIDFGVAQATEDVASGAPFGTAAYMAPEQAAGERVDGRADLYALGVLLFQMVTGEHPFPSATDHEYILRHADDKPPRPEASEPSCPRALGDAIVRCLAKRADGRFASAAELAAALRAIDLHAVARPGHRRWLAGAVALAVAGAAIAVIAPRYFGSSAASPPNAGAAIIAQVAAPPAAAAAPPAPAPPPPPAPPPAAETVAIDVASVPPGATVYRAGETIPLGTTPFTATLLRADKRSQLRFELAGFEPHTSEIEVGESHGITVKLVHKAPTAAATAPTPKPKAKQVQREGVLDPFAP